MFPGVGKMPLADVGFHQGTVVEWDQEAGSNRIAVAGSVLEDLPVAAMGSVMVGTGDVVVLMRYHNQYFVMGRVAPVSQSLAIRYVVGTDDDNWTTSSAWADLNHGQVPTLTDVYIGPSRRCLVFLSAALAGASGTLGELHFQVSGASTISPPSLVGDRTNIGAVGGGGSATRMFGLTASDGLQSGLNTFEVKYRRMSGTDDAFFSNTVLIVLPL
jgi:hypothetical protein